MKHRILAVAAILATAFSFTPPTDAAAPAQGGEFYRTQGTAAVRNFPDRNGASFIEVEAGTIVRAFSTSQGIPPFREVEVGGGFPAWVFGKYLQPTNVDGVLVVSGSRVNMRPSPDLTPGAMPLRSSKLNAGQRVKLVKRANKAISLAEDWVLIQAPANTRAWIEASMLVPVDKAEGGAAWKAAAITLPTKATAKPAGTAQPRKIKVPRITEETAAQLTKADAAFDRVIELRSPTSEDWRGVVVAYAAVIASAPEGTVTLQNAQTRHRTAVARMELASLREDVSSQARKHDAELSKVNAYLETREARASARQGRFRERGWLKQETIEGRKAWYLTFAGETVAEVVCNSGRYNLAIFEGHDLGILGVEIKP
ncbi:MAG: hypothetical protein ACPGPE_15410 [Planctomycetota bacterium]